MSNNLNTTYLLGRLTHDLDPIAYTPGGLAVLNFSVATNSSRKDKEGVMAEKATYHKCVVFGKSAEIFNQYMQKGSQALITGRYVNDNYTDKGGVKHKGMKLEVQSFEFIGAKTAPKAPTEYHQKGAVNEPVDEPFDPNEIPF